MELSLSLEATHVLVTGAAGHIGRLVVTAFLSAGAHVSALDLSPSLFTSLPSHPDLLPLSADVTSTSQLAEAFKAARERFGTVECCIHLAGLDLSVLSKKGVVDMEPEDWERVLGVNVGGAFSVSREWAKEIREVISNREAVEGSLDGQVEKDNAARRIDETKVRSEGGEMTTSKGQGKKALKNVSLILVGSESGWFGERMNAAYAASKSAIQVGLLQSLRAEVPRIYERARVNVVAPGPVDTAQFRKECVEDPEQLWLDAQATTALRRPVPVEAVAKCILYLASENMSGHVHGQVLNVDGGKQGKIMWTKEECA